MRDSMCSNSDTARVYMIKETGRCIISGGHAAHNPEPRTPTERNPGSRMGKGKEGWKGREEVGKEGRRAGGQEGQEGKSGHPGVAVDASRTDQG